MGERPHRDEGRAPRFDHGEWPPPGAEANRAAYVQQHVVREPGAFAGRHGFTKSTGPVTEMIAFYNEIDAYCCAWLSNLMDAGLITPGIISNESIEDLTPDELNGYDRVHLFAGIGVWDYALRLAGWPSNRPVWTLSCPCQPFSSAGQGVGFDDKRHLWPHAFHLIGQCRPVECIGEQVASKDADPWLDLVQTDLEALGYALGAVPFPSAGVGAPHIRDRLYWVADAELPERRSRDQRGTVIDGQEGGRYKSADRTRERGQPCGLADSRRVCTRGTARPGETESGRPFGESTGHGHACGLDTPNDAGLEGFGSGHQAEGRRIVTAGSVAATGEFSGMGPPDGGGGGSEKQAAEVARYGHSAESAGVIRRPFLSARELAEIPFTGPWVDPARNANTCDVDNRRRPGPTNGFWRDADWLGCRDGKWRPVSPKPQPLVDGSSESLGRVRPEIVNQIEKEINAIS